MNLRPSGYEPDELPGCSIPRQLRCLKTKTLMRRIEREIRNRGFTRFGGDLLSHVLRRSTIGAVALNFRVRNGAGCFAHAMTTKPKKASTAHHRCGVWEAAYCEAMRVPTPCHSGCVVKINPAASVRQQGRPSHVRCIWCSAFDHWSCNVPPERRFCCYWIKSSLSDN